MTHHVWVFCGRNIILHILPVPSVNMDMTMIRSIVIVSMVAVRRYMTVVLPAAVTAVMPVPVLPIAFAILATSACAVTRWRDQQAVVFVPVGRMAIDVQTLRTSYGCCNQGDQRLVKAIRTSRLHTRSHCLAARPLRHWLARSWRNRSSLLRRWTRGCCRLGFRSNRCFGCRWRRRSFGRQRLGWRRSWRSGLLRCSRRFGSSWSGKFGRGSWRFSGRRLDGRRFSRDSRHDRVMVCCIENLQSPVRIQPFEALQRR